MVFNSCYFCHDRENKDISNFLSFFFFVERGISKINLWTLYRIPDYSIFKNFLTERVGTGDTVPKLTHWVSDLYNKIKWVSSEKNNSTFNGNFTVYSLNQYMKKRWGALLRNSKVRSFIKVHYTKVDILKTDWPQTIGPDIIIIITCSISRCMLCITFCPKGVTL